MSSLTDNTTIVVGASRGLGRGIAAAFAQTGAPVVTVARTRDATAAAASGPGAIQAEVADAADATVAAGLLDRYRPEVVVLVAGLITAYAQEEASRAGLEITFTTVMPQFAPETGVGRPAVAAYAAQAGLSVEDYLDRQAFELLTPEIAGSAVVELVQTDAAALAPAYLLNGRGLHTIR